MKTKLGLLSKLLALTVILVGMSSCGLLVEEKNGVGTDPNMAVPGKFPPLFSAGGTDASSASFRMRARIGRPVEGKDLSSNNYQVKSGASTQ